MSLSNKSSSRSNTFIGITIIMVILVTIIGIWLLKKNSTSSGAMRHVTYYVESTGGYAFIIYTDSSGHNTAGEMMTTPFTRSVSLPVGKDVYLTASNPSQTGTVSCSIRLDNRDWKQSKATHPVDSVACGGIIR